MKRVWPVVVVLCVLVGCTPDPKSSKGFSLPDGDANQGEQTFVRLNCHACHTVADVKLPEPAVERETSIALGGEAANVVTYGHLVTSIINPSHRFPLGYSEETIKTDGQSKMRNYNGELTVEELINLVAFLQSHYKVRAYQPTPYVPYY